MPKTKDLIVFKVDRARQLLAEATTAPAAKRVVDIAHAAEIYAKRAHLGQEAIQYAHTVKIDAQTLLGGFLKATPKNEGGYGPGRGKKGGYKGKPAFIDAPPTLKRLGLEKRDSSDSQLLHTIQIQRPELHEELRTGKKRLKAVRQSLQRNEQVEAIKSAKLPTGIFHVIVIDPPWSYANRADDSSHRAANPYPSMSHAKLLALPVIERAHDNAILWLWTTNAFMVQAHELATAWGFTIKTILTWGKNKLGLGDWLRGQTEHCLMAVRGKPVVTLTNQTTLLLGHMREHSRKPDSFYELVESLCPGSKCELFARQSRKGWTTFGAESELFNDAHD